MNNEDKLKMLEEFLEERSNLNSQEYKIKYKDIPERLFRYQKINRLTLETLEKNEIYMNSSEQFNDPFDCRGVYFYENEFNTKRNDNNRDLLDCKEINNINKITCFSECPNNLPMWGNYADNRKGMCVEYNFKNLGEDHKITKNLWPVIYRSEKYDITSSLKKLWEVASKEPSEIIPMIRKEELMMLFFKNLFKHTSWEYEKEWRLIIPQKENNKKLPITPTAIYAGDKCDPKDLDELKEISKKLSCELIQLKPTGYDNKDFIFQQKL